jgi:hypothetical protein
MIRIDSSRLTLALPLAASTLLALGLAACDKSPSKPAPTSAGSPADKGHAHAPGDGHDDHDHDHAHGPEVALGQHSAGGFSIAAVREGELKPSSDAPVDVTFTGGSDSITAVRLWIGAEDAKGSLKAKAEPEGKGWHAHVETPASFDGAKLWVEFETDKGAKAVVGFDLKK